MSNKSTKNEKKMNKKLLLSLNILSALLLSSCEPSNKEIQLLIETLSLTEKTTAKLQYDKALLANLNHLYSRGVENYLSLAHETTMKNYIPSKDSNRAMHYFLQEHANNRLCQSRREYQEIYTSFEPLIVGEHTIWHYVDYPRTVYSYYTHFPKQLEQEIKRAENDVQYQPVQKGVHYPYLRNQHSKCSNVKE